MSDLFHTVQSGDTLYEIAKIYQVPVDAIVRANRLNNPNEIFINQVLRIPQVYRPIWYIVRYGDTLASIAKRFFTTVEQLVELNSLADPDVIYPGDRLRIR